MIKVEIDSIRVSLMSNQRLVVLKDLNQERYLPIWIGPFEADAITVELQDVLPERPLTHDLLKATIQEMGGRIKHIFINALRREIYYAHLVIEVGERELVVDSRPSDAIALAVRVNAPIYVEETVMDRASVTPEEDMEAEEFSESEAPLASESRESFRKRGWEKEKENEEDLDESRFSAFADFVNSLDLDELDDDDK